MARSDSSAVRIARLSSEVCTTSGSTPASAIKPPASIPSIIPTSVRSTSTHPVKMPFAFHSLCP